MADTSEALSVVASELNAPVEQLLTPLTRRRRQSLTAHFAIDNGAYANFQRKAFRNLLRRHFDARDLCRFVAVPDVVGSARRTLEIFDIWREELTDWPLALVAQDGQERLPIPWRQIEAIFIGGSTVWKEGMHARAIVQAAKALGKWVHIGRVNTPHRFDYFKQMGAHSCDGTGIARYSWMRREIATAPRSRQSELFTGENYVT